MGTSLYDTPAASAISQLLGQLTGGQAPQPPQPPSPQGSPSLFHRVLSNLAGIPGAIGHGISEFERPQAPAEAQALVNAGLLSPEQVAAARPSFLQSLIADHQPGGAQGQYGSSLANIAKIAQEAQMQRVRTSDPALSSGGDPADVMRQHAAYLVRMGYPEEGAKIAQAAKDLQQPAGASRFVNVGGAGLVDVSDPNAPRVVVPIPKTEKEAQIIRAKEGVFSLGPDGMLRDVATKAVRTASIHPLEPPVSYQPLTVDNPTPGGPPVVVPFNPRQGTIGSPLANAKPTGQGAGSAPIASKVGQFGEMLKKADDLLPKMEALGVSLGQSTAGDIAQHGIGVGGMHIPGTQGLGALLANRTPDYAQYQAALSPFILAAAHALSGARINQDQVAQIKQSIELKPGDSPQVRQQKIKNVVDLINSIGGSLPAEGVSQQEAQIGNEGLGRLGAYGYQPRAAMPGPAVGGASTLRAKYDAAVEHLKSQGKTPAQIKGIIGERP